MPIVEHDLQQFHLSHEEEDKLNQFQIITNFPSDELPLIIKLLKNHSWNLEPALGRYFDGTWRNNTLFETETPPPTSIPTPPRVATPILDNATSGRQSPFLASQLGLIPSLVKVSAIPKSLQDKKQYYVGLGKNNASTWNIFDANNRANMSIPSLLLMLLPSIFLNVVLLFWKVISFGFKSDLDSKIARLPKFPEENVIPIKEHLPALVKDEIVLKKLVTLSENNMTFNEALTICREEYKFLLVILVGNLSPIKGPDGSIVSKQDVNSCRFISSVLSSPSIIDIIDQHSDDMIVYFRSVHDYEPWLLGKQLKVKFTPECCLIGNVLNVNGSMNGSIQPSILSRLRVSSATRFSNSIKIMTEKYGPELVVSRTEMQEVKLAREIKEAQNAAYEESLRKDQIKKHEREQVEHIQMLEEKKKKMEKTLHHLFWLRTASRLLNEDNISNGEVVEKLATIQIRNSKGSRFIEKFKSTTTPHQIYLAVGAHLYLNDFERHRNNWKDLLKDKMNLLSQDDETLCFKPDIGSLLASDEFLSLIDQEWSAFQSELDAPYNVTFPFDLVSPFPKYALEADAEIALGDIPQLWPNGSLLVEEILEDSDEDVSNSDHEDIDTT